MSLMDNVKQLDSKQKVMLVATIGCLGLVFYLAYATFFPASDDTSAAPVPVITTPAVKPSIAPDTTAAPIETTSLPNTSSLPAPTLPAAMNNSQDTQQNDNTPPSPANLALLAQSQQMQQQYIQLVNQYQLAELQQKLAQVDSQIASSKLTTTKSLVELKKLEPLLGSQTTNQSGTSSTAPAAANSGPQIYQTMYVGRVAGVWQAMLQSAGQYFQVSVGMRLPDGSAVSQISSRGVVITNANGVPIFLPMTKNID